jgi:hypothetical protein
VAPTNRERRAAKKRRRDTQRSGEHAGARADPADEQGGDTATTDPGLAAETLQAILRRAADDLAAGDDQALSEMRHVLAEHLARRRERVLAACDAVLAESTGPAAPVEDDTGLAAELAAGGSASSWAERTRARTEEAAVATVRVRAARLT